MAPQRVLAHTWLEADPIAKTLHLVVETPAADGEGDAEVQRMDLTPNLAGPENSEKRQQLRDVFAVASGADIALPATAQNRVAIEADLLQGLAQMQTIIDAPQVTFSNLAQAQTAVRDIQTAIKAEARQLRRLSRLALNLLDGTD